MIKLEPIWHCVECDDDNCTCSCAGCARAKRLLKKGHIPDADFNDVLDHILNREVLKIAMEDNKTTDEVKQDFKDEFNFIKKFGKLPHHVETEDILRGAGIDCDLENILP